MYEAWIATIRGLRPCYRGDVVSRGKTNIPAGHTGSSPLQKETPLVMKRRLCPTGDRKG